jgi:hypothetical protein
MSSQQCIRMPFCRTVFACRMFSFAATAAYAGDAVEIANLKNWRGENPHVQNERQPEGLQKSPNGYISDAGIFTTVWQALKPGEKAPQVDFGRNFIVFSRNVDFYNRTSIFKVTLKDGVIEVLAMETRSALPIEDKASMAMAVIPRDGVRSIQTGTRRIPVSAGH